MFDFTSFSIWINLLIFTVAGGVVWFAGHHAAKVADRLAVISGLGKAFFGLVFLALATETPEIATTITASMRGNSPLAVNNLFGGVVIQTAILVIGDLVWRGKALTYFTPKPVLVLQGQLLIILLAISAGFMLIGEQIWFFQVGLWSTLLFLGYLLSVYLSKVYESGSPRWKPIGSEKVSGEHIEKEAPDPEKKDNFSLRNQTLTFIGLSLMILVGGFFLARTAESLAEQTGLGASFIGATLLAFSTSLPELSTVISAIRLGASDMAISNIFGSNLIMMALVFLSDVFFRQGPILQNLPTPTLFTILMGIIVTGLYLVGLTERRNRTFLGMGWDSAAVLLFFVLHLAGLYYLR